MAASFTKPRDNAQGGPITGPFLEVYNSCI